MNMISEMLENKLLLYSALAVIAFTIISIILIKKVSKEKDEEVKIDIEKIDGEKSLFNEILEEKEKNPSNQLDLDSMIEKMQKDLDAKASEVVEKFESEQEEKSVISYQELVGNKKDKVEQIEIENIDEDEPSSTIIENEEVNTNDYNETISTALEKLNLVEKDLVTDENESEVMPISEESEEVIPVSKLNMKEDFVEAIKTGNYEEDNIISEEKVSEGKFKATEFISPIFGVQDIKMQYPTVQNMKEFKENSNKYNKFELEDTLSIKKIDKEVHQDEDFLNSLKEFRKNLE